MRIIIQPDYNAMSLWTANYLAQRITAFAPTEQRPFVLGLPTGSSPIGTYRNLVALHALGKLSFKNVGTVMGAREVVIMISGHSKARALQKVVEEGVSHMWTVSALQMHTKGMIVCDDAATDELKVATVRYFKDIERSNLAGRPID